MTDDARLVLRILQDAVGAGGRAANYMKVTSLLKSGERWLASLLPTSETGGQLEVKARSVINATGAWADRLRNEVNPEKRVRPLRGSHLVLPAHRLPRVRCAHHFSS